MIERVRAALTRRPLLGAAISVVVHAALLLALFWVPPGHKSVQKRGDALIVELPNPQESGSLGTPGPSPDAPIPAASAVKARPTSPAPPARPVSPPPAPAARPTPKTEPRQAPRVVASAPQPPPSAEPGDAPTSKSSPQQPEPDVEKQPVLPEPAAPPAVASAPALSQSQVAMIPPSVPPDIRSALRRGGGGRGTGTGGAGGSGLGRAGIEGEPVPLDSKDPDFSDYLERVRQLIKKHWSYPCVKNTDTRECEYKSGVLLIEFGILRNGQLGFVELQRSTGFPIMDDYAANAIKLASPFPVIPAALLQNRTGMGLPIRARFNYLVETGLTNVIR